ncbi:MAG: ABC transporter ATP-binding protein [Candidatus Pacebacteria bacterium]|nr:ABC transporter ATP-binding protein [Candidatus Paceibacterota bacterium]
MSDNNKTKEKVIPNTPLAFFIHASAPHKWWSFLAIFAVIVAASVGSGSSYLFKLVVDAVEAGEMNTVLFWGLLFPVVLLFAQLMYRISGFAAANWTTRAAKTATDNLNRHVLQHSHTYFINRFAGSVLSKQRNVIGAVEEIIPDFLWAQLASFVGFLATFILLWLVDMIVASLFVLLLIVLFFVNKYLAPKKAELSKISSEANTILTGRTVDTFSNISAVRQYAKFKQELNGLAILTEKRRIAHRNNWFYTEKLLLLNIFILFAFSLGMFWLILNKWEGGLITSGDFIMVVALMFNISGSLVFIGRAFNAMAKTVGELREGLDDLLVDYEIVDNEEAKSLKIKNGSIDWRSVDFGFEDNQVFSKFNLNIPAGQRVGLVGTSGAGKTTFVSLLLRQHELNGGRIFIDGQDIASVTQDSLRQAIAVVPQEPALFHRTIRENIAYSKPEASHDEVVAVAKQAHAHEFIEKLPQGYDTLVGERGVKLSGGQKQRVAIARAMLKNAPILILDEATSALDSESEMLIQKALHTLMEGKTVIAIAHRLSTLREMDRIVVLDSGVVVEDGDHNTLKDKGGVYAKLWSHQSGGFLLE